jgi:hypothetical protein
MLTGMINIPKLDGMEVSPGIWLIGEGTPVPHSNKLRCLADVNGELCVVELAINFC